MLVVSSALALSALAVGIGNYLFPYKPSLKRDFIEACTKLKLFYEVNKQVTLPRINNEITYEWGTRLLVHLPAGLPSSKFTEKKDALAEALRINPEKFHIRYDDGLIIDIVTVDFPEMLPYRPPTLKHKYRVFIGVNYRGEARFYDFAGSYPHLLIAGISGGGKSVMVRNILTQLVTGVAPDLYLCDLKGGVELGIFRQLACVKSLAINLRDVLATVNEVEAIMNRRYDILLKNGGQEWKGKRIIFVVDELADFKVRKGDPDAKLKNEIKSVITRLSAKGRAAGVIILLATQRPSADIVDGLIKTNIAASICFRTRDGVQSQIVLDNQSAAELPDIPGRFIYQTSVDETLQAPFISVDEVRKLIANLPQKPQNVTENSTGKISVPTEKISEVNVEYEYRQQQNGGEVEPLESNFIEL